MSLTLLIESKHNLDNLIKFDILQKLNPPNLMRFNHILQNPPDLICTILTLDIVGIAVSMPRHLPYIIIPGPLQNKAYGKVRIVVFLLEACLNEPCLTTDSANLLTR